MCKFRLFILTSILFVVFFITGCDSKNQNKAPQKEMPPIPVAIYEIDSAGAKISRTYPGIIKANSEVDVLARVEGVLKKRYYKEGSFVKKGDSLYLIEQDRYLAALNSAKANVNKAEAALTQSSSDWERAQKLSKTQALSEQEYDAFYSAYLSSKAELEASKAALNNARLDYRYTTVEAPISGKAGKKHQDVGDLVGSSTQNTLLTTITAIDPIQIEFSIPSNDAKSYMKYLNSQELNVSANGVYGEIDYIAPRLDSSTDTLQLRAIFPNKNEEFLVGDFTQISINGIELQDVVLIPEQSIVKTPKGEIVFVYTDGVAKPRPIKSSLLVNDKVVIQEGLNVGDKVITNNIAKVRPNAKVQLMGSN